MATTTLDQRFKVRGGTAAALASVNEVPLARELVFETDTRKWKMGDGSTAYNSLAYFGGSTPTGTGFRHVTAGTEDVASRYPSDAEVTFTDIATNNASTTTHGFLKKLSNSATEYMDGTGNWSVPAGAGGGSDAYFSSVKSLLQCNGTNGSTTITDIIGKTWTAYNGAAISTAESRFGGSSLLLDGTNDYCETAASADWNFGTGDFHLSGWMSSRQTTGTYTGMIALNVAASGIWRVGNRYNSAGNFSFNFHDGTNYRDITTGVNPNDGRWHFWEVERRSGVFILRLDGRILTVRDDLTSSTVGDSTSTLRIGFNAANSTYFKGYQNDIRITKGTARENYPIVVPTVAAPTS